MEYALSPKIEVIAPGKIFRIQSPTLELGRVKAVEPVYLLTQYFLENKSEARKQELRTCLRENWANPLITRIYLINERKYSLEELGFTAAEEEAVLQKIEQRITGRRLNFADPMDVARDEKLHGFVIMANADIYFAPNVCRLFSTSAFQRRSMMALLRMDVPAYPATQRPSLSARSDSQDTWIFHSDHMPTDHALVQMRDIEFGKPGCDNKIAYVMFTDGYTVINDPVTITTFHLHLSDVRNYSSADVLSPPFLYVIPAQIPRKVLIR